MAASKNVDYDLVAKSGRTKIACTLSSVDYRTMLKLRVTAGFPPVKIEKGNDLASIKVQFAAVGQTAQ